MIERKVEALRREDKNTFPGSDAFELFDTYGFPVDLTQLILRENNMTLNEDEFTRELNAQKERSRDDAAVTAGDWVIVHDSDSTVFTGYEHTEDTVMIARYRKVTSRGREAVHLIFDKTPFYAEAGGQTGDKGYIAGDGEKIMISDTVKENNLIIHISDKVPAKPSAVFTAVVNADARQNTANNHTATHLMHHALREILGKHVEQRGSLVTPEKLRFDFSHFSQVTPEELTAVEQKVNEMIMKNITSEIHDDTPVGEALAMGAMALFGEKYGERVRVVSFGDSVELCGGTHVESTSRIGLFKIVSEGAVAAGIRRIEAVTGRSAMAFVNEKLKTLDEISTMLKSTGNPVSNISRLMAENASLKHSIGKMQLAAAALARDALTAGAVTAGSCRIYSGILENTPADSLKNIAQQIRQTDTGSIIIIGSESEGKAALVVGLGDEAAATSQLNAVEVIKAVASEISGGGGGQPIMATAGGKRPEGLPGAVAKAVALAKKML